MTPFAQSLVLAAGKAVFDEIKKYPQPEPWSGSVGWGATDIDVGRVAVVAVLETLAETGVFDPQDSAVFNVWADEIKGQS